MTMLASITFLFLTISSSSVVSGLNIFQPYKAFPSLSKLAEAQKGTELFVRLDVGEKDQQHLYLDRFRLKLLDEEADKDHPKLPGIDGPSPSLSSGARKVDVLECPSFIDMWGTQKVEFNNGCWEMVWRDTGMAGTLICGFDVPQKADRNGATLPSGKIYLSFVVWTRDGLTEKQARKAEVEAECKELLAEKDEEFLKYQQQKNILMKALHYRNAAAAVEKYQLSGIYHYQHVPSNEDVIPISNGLLLTTKGTVWNKGNDFFTQHKKQLLGSVVIHPDLKEKDELSKLRP